MSARQWEDVIREDLVAELERLRGEQDKADAVIVYQHSELEHLRARIVDMEEHWAESTRRYESELERLREENEALSNELGDAIDQSTERWKRIQAREQSDAISPEYLARLHRIEDAARAYVEWANVIEPTEPFAALRAALEEEA